MLMAVKDVLPTLTTKEPELIAFVIVVSTEDCRTSIVTTMLPLRTPVTWILLESPPLASIPARKAWVKAVVSIVLKSPGKVADADVAACNTLAATM